MEAGRYPFRVIYLLARETEFTCKKSDLDCQPEILRARITFDQETTLTNHQTNLNGRFGSSCRSGSEPSKRIQARKKKDLIKNITLLEE